MLGVGYDCQFLPAKLSVYNKHMGEGARFESVISSGSITGISAITTGNSFQGFNHGILAITNVSS
ncbi:MAG: hypothetical protein EBQ94_02890 [Flavobacteriales bacterium]|nr:hypothetical protein [Flavobacteriales bacterium]